jgi:hypothetical protein
MTPGGNRCPGGVVGWAEFLYRYSLGADLESPAVMNIVPAWDEVQFGVLVQCSGCPMRTWGWAVRIGQPPGLGGSGCRWLGAVRRGGTPERSCLWKTQTSALRMGRPSGVCNRFGIGPKAAPRRDRPVDPEARGLTGGRSHARAGDRRGGERVCCSYIAPS